MGINEYIIVNKSTLEKRIEDWENKYGNEDVESSSKAFILMKEILSQSTSLIPEIEKAFDTGFYLGVEETDDEHEMEDAKQEYISNLKLNI